MNMMSANVLPNDGPPGKWILSTARSNNSAKEEETLGNSGYLSDDWDDYESGDLVVGFGGARQATGEASSQDPSRRLHHTMKVRPTKKQQQQQQQHQDSKSGNESSESTLATPINNDEIDSALEVWELIPQIFRAWDMDGNETLDSHEILLGLRRYCDVRGLTYNPMDIISIIHEVDDNHDEMLDNREFSIFLTRFTAGFPGITMSDIATFMAEELEGENNKMTDRCRKLIPDLFHLWDIDDSGSISRTELNLALNDYCRAEGVTLDAKRICQLFTEADRDGDRQISLKEFSVFICLFSEEVKIDVIDVVEGLVDVLEEMAKIIKGWALMPRLFAVFDSDRSNSIDRHEVNRGLKRYCDSERYSLDDTLVDRLFEEADSNGDASLDDREFAVFIARFADTTKVSLEKLAHFLMQDAIKSKQKEEGWLLLPKLFEVLDYDRSDSLDRNEVAWGLEKFCEATGKKLDYKATMNLFEESDDNGDCSLDQREFSVFLSKWADSNSISLEDLAVFMLENVPLSLKLYDQIRQLWSASVGFGTK